MRSLTGKFEFVADGPLVTTNSLSDHALASGLPGIRHGQLNRIVHECNDS